MRQNVLPLGNPPGAAFVQNLKRPHPETQESADLVRSVPSPEFEAALDELRRLGEEVTTDSVRGEDVTEEFVDLQSRERNLLAVEEGLLKLYDRAEDVEDALSTQREITAVSAVRWRRYRAGSSTWNRAPLPPRYPWASGR